MHMVTPEDCGEIIEKHIEKGENCRKTTLVKDVDEYNG